MPKRSNSIKSSTITPTKNVINTPLRRSARLLSITPVNLHSETPKPKKDSTGKPSKKLFDEKSKRSKSIKPSTITTSKNVINTPLRRSARLLTISPVNLHSEILKPKKDSTEKSSKKLVKSDEKPSISAISVIGYRRSPRFSNKVVENSEVQRYPRLSLIDKSNSTSKKSKAKKSISLNEVVKKVDASKVEKIAQSSGKKSENGVNFQVVLGLKAVKNRDLSERKQETRACKKNQEIEVCEKPPEIKVSRKRKRGVERNDHKKNGGINGWTRAQEMALQRAYLIAKPTPSFWKQVSRLVPGKSAKDCFERVHSDHITPPQVLPRSRTKKMNLSPLGQFSLSASKLLSPSGLKAKKLSRYKAKSYVAQRTVRQLLQKHCRVDQSREVDLFSILEPNVNPSTQDLELDDVSTPKRFQVKQGFLQKCNEQSSSGKKKPLSRFKNLPRVDIVSPPVLKQVKNPALHERYIDQLHCREAKRKTAAGKENTKCINIQKTNVIRAAKNALVSDAIDAISKLQHLQKNANDDSSDIDGIDRAETDADEYDEL